MKNWDDVVYIARKEIDKWFAKQCRNIYERYYWKYSETTEECPGRIWIESERDNGGGYCLHKLSIGKTKGQELSEFLKVAGRLPILEIQ